MGQLRSPQDKHSAIAMQPKCLGKRMHGKSFLEAETKQESEAAALHTCPAKTETFLRAVPRARVEKISSCKLAGQVPFWHHLGMSQGTPQLDP